VQQLFVYIFNGLHREGELAGSMLTDDLKTVCSAPKVTIVFVLIVTNNKLLLTYLISILF
jgi:hypothetical protein